MLSKIEPIDTHYEWGYGGQGWRLSPDKSEAIIFPTPPESKYKDEYRSLMLSPIYSNFDDGTGVDTVQEIEVSFTAKIYSGTLEFWGSKSFEYGKDSKPIPVKEGFNTFTIKPKPVFWPTEPFKRYPTNIGVANFKSYQQHYFLPSLVADKDCDASIESIKIGGHIAELKPNQRYWTPNFAGGNTTLSISPDAWESNKDFSISLVFRVKALPPVPQTIIELMDTDGQTRYLQLHPPEEGKTEGRLVSNLKQDSFRTIGFVEKNKYYLFNVDVKDFPRINRVSLGKGVSSPLQGSLIGEILMFRVSIDKDGVQTPKVDLDLILNDVQNPNRTSILNLDNAGFSGTLSGEPFASLMWSPHNL